jgi:hypothetical protein
VKFLPPLNVAVISHSLSNISPIKDLKYNHSIEHALNVHMKVDEAFIISKVIT